VFCLLVLFFIFVGLNNQLMRKLYFLTMAIIGLSFASQAQITKGSTFLGGSFSFSSGSGETASPVDYKRESFGWGIRPQFGKAIATNKVLGLYVHYSNSGYEQKLGSTNIIDEGSSYGGGVFLRNYYPLNSRFSLFGDGSFGVGINSSERKENAVLTGKNNATDISLGITPGISFAAGKKLHLEASLNSLLSVAYSFSESSTYNASGAVVNKGNERQFNIGANANGFSGLSVGLRWILPSKG